MIGWIILTAVVSWYIGHAQGVSQMRKKMIANDIDPDELD